MELFKQRFAHPVLTFELDLLLVQKDPGPALEQKDENAFKEFEKE